MRDREGNNGLNVIELMNVVDCIMRQWLIL